MARVTAFTTALFGQENANTLSRSQSYQPDPVDLTAPEYVAAAYAGDFFFNCPQRRLLAAAERTSASAPALYQFLWAHRPSWLEPERLRIAHGSEIAFLFGVQPRTRYYFTDVCSFAQRNCFRAGQQYGDLRVGLLILCVHMFAIHSTQPCADGR